MGVAEGVRVEHGAGLGRYEQVGAVWVLCVFLHQQLHRPLRDGQLADGVGRLGLADHQFTVETVVLLSQETNPLTVEVRMEVETGEVRPINAFRSMCRKSTASKSIRHILQRSSVWSGWICAKHRILLNRENMSIIPARLKRSRQSRMRCGTLA